MGTYFGGIVRMGYYKDIFLRDCTYGLLQGQALAGFVRMGYYRDIFWRELS